MRWRGPSGQFLGSVRPRAHLAGAGARDPWREGWHHGRVGRARSFREARCERSPSPGSSGWVAARPRQRELEGPRPFLSHARGETRARWLRAGAAAAAGPRRDASGPDAGNPGSSASGGSRPASLRKEEEPAPEPPQPRSPGRGGGEGLSQDGGRGGEAAATAAAAGVSARLAAPTRARAGPRAGLRPAPQARGRAGRRAPPAPGECRPGARSPAFGPPLTWGRRGLRGRPPPGRLPGRRGTSRGRCLGTRPTRGFLSSAAGRAGRGGERGRASGGGCWSLEEEWAAAGPGRPECPAGRGLRGPRRRGPGRRVGPAQVAARASSGAELVAARECARGQGG